MKKIMLLIFFSLVSACIFAQKVYKSDYDTKMLEGTWVATSGNKSYEITFVKGTIYERDMKITMEGVFGSIAYLENNKMIRSADIKGLGSNPLTVFYRGEDRKFNIRYSEFEDGKRINGNVRFDINPDGKTAHWYNLYKTRLWGQEISKETFDIPKELTFTKKPITKSGSSELPAPHFEFPLKK